jgi:SAM-dependent methyltransferase
VTAADPWHLEESAEPAQIDVGLRYTRQFVNEVLSPNAKCLLEIGSGDGSLALALQSSDLKVVALEPDYKAVRSARQKGVSVLWADWPIALGAEFDAILFTRSLHHIPELRQSLLSAWLSLRSGGVLIAEEALIGGEDEDTLEWFRSTIVRMKAESGLNPSSEFFDELAARKKDLRGFWRQAHGDERHSTVRMSDEILLRFGHLEVSKCAYLFRYLVPFVPDSAAAQLLNEECRMINSGAIVAFGRRFVASKRVHPRS